MEIYDTFHDLICMMRDQNSEEIIENFITKNKKYLNYYTVLMTAQFDSTYFGHTQYILEKYSNMLYKKALECSIIDDLYNIHEYINPQKVISCHKDLVIIHCPIYQLLCRKRMLLPIDLLRVLKQFL